MTSSLHKSLIVLLMISFVYSSSPFVLIHAEEIVPESSTEPSNSEDPGSGPSDEAVNSEAETSDETLSEEDETDPSPLDEGTGDTEMETAADAVEGTATDEEGTTEESAEETSGSAEAADADTTISDAVQESGAEEDNETDGTLGDTLEEGALTSGTTTTEGLAISTTTSTSTDTHDLSASTTLAFESSATTTEATTTSTSGSENASTTDATGSTTVTTGTAVALANILNLVNTNFINSDGIVLFKNFFETLTEDFDLRAMYDSLADFGCSLTACSDDQVRTNIENDALIDNELYVEAVTGGNSIEHAGDAVIDTGDAYAGVNLVNIANTNVIDSNYLLLTMNAFQNVEGDIIFPSLRTFLNGLGNTGGLSALDVVNAGEIENTVNLGADTGNNSIADSGSSTIQTGESTASTNVFNQLNTTLAGGQNISIIFRVHGSWAGEIFGAPEGLRWMENGNGGIYLFDEALHGGGQGDLEVYATNTARIRNNVNVVALTGENAISGSETALISTGNAYAGANIMNVANATVVGRNWMLAIVNIFGDFTGNIAFGRPDLWVGGQVTVPDRISNGSELTYALTVINNGDSDATEVTLRNAYDAQYLDIADASLPFSTDAEGAITWELPDLEPGEAIEIIYRGIVKAADHNTDIESMFTVSERETDNDTSDNTDILTITTSSKQSSGGSVRIRPAGKKDLTSAATTDDLAAIQNAIEVERVSPAVNVHLNESNTVEQKVIIRNTTGRILRNAVFHDFFKDPDDHILHEDIWDLGDIQPYETIEIAYTIEFGNDAPTGLYALDTTMEWEGLSKNFARNGTVLAWESTLSNIAAAAPLMVAQQTEATTTDDSFFDIFAAQSAEAQEPPSIIRQAIPAAGWRFGATGILFLLAALMILYGWHRAEWYIEERRKLVLHH